MAGRLLNLLAHLIVAVKVEDVGDEIEGILVVLDLGVESREVEAVGQVLLVDLAKVLVAARRDKLARVSLACRQRRPRRGRGRGRTQSRQ